MVEVTRPLKQLQSGSSFFEVPVFAPVRYPSTVKVRLVLCITMLSIIDTTSADAAAEITRRGSLVLSSSTEPSALVRDFTRRGML